MSSIWEEKLFGQYLADRWGSWNELYGDVFKLYMIILIVEIISSPKEGVLSLLSRQNHLSNVNM